jgi:EthD domain
MKLLIVFAARGGTRPELVDLLRGECAHLQDRGAQSVCAMQQVDNDPFALAVPGMRSFQASIDARFADASDAIEAISGLEERLGSLLHLDLSGAFGGEDHVVIDGPPTPVRYQYLMRRKYGTTREAYFEHYVNNHAKFGLRTPGIEGYVQFHIDPVLSRALANAAGVGLWAADSVSELHASSLETMLAGFASDATLAEDAGADEERFVDRTNSVMFTSDVVYRAS